MADALEAIIGAVYLDAGYAAAQALVQRLFQAVDISPQMDAIGKDPKISNPNACYKFGIFLNTTKIWNPANG